MRDPAQPAPNTDGMWEDLPDTDISGWFDPRIRCIDVEKMTTALSGLLPFNTASAEFNAPIGSAAFALELNDKSYFVEILPADGSTPNASLPPRQLWLRPVPTVLHDIDTVPVATTIHPVITPGVTNAQPQLLQLPTPDFSAAAILSGLRVEIPPQIPPGTIPVVPLLLDRHLLSLHPTYRAAAPLPFIGLNGRKLFSAHDYLPTQTTHLVDLVFSLHRNVAGSPSTLISSIVVILPTSSADSTVPAEEPLLAGPYTGPGATMLHNKRWAPLLTVAPGQLQIKLVPRSAAQVGLPNTLAGDASFVLKGCEIAATKTPVDVQVMGEGVVQRGLVRVGIKKTSVGLIVGQPPTVVDYAMEIVKKDTVDRDAGGEAV